MHRFCSSASGRALLWCVLEKYSDSANAGMALGSCNQCIDLCMGSRVVGSSQQIEFDVYFAGEIMQFYILDFLGERLVAPNFIQFL